MALDKQQILNELGSVMNKLQSADCGCMGNIFSKGQHTNQVGQSGATMSSLPTCGGCRRGCCHGHGYNSGCSRGYSAGEPCANSYMGGQCNPPKLYADTYNYLNSNLMQPIVNEVYQDLKSLNETNTIANNPLASKMLNQPHGGGAALQDMPLQSEMSGSVTTQNPNMANQQVGQMMGGMGPNIVSMMNSSVSGKTGQISAPMASGLPKGQPSGDMNAGINMSNGANYSGQQGQSQYMQHQSMTNTMNPNNPNAMAGNMQQNGQATPSYKVNYSNPAAQQMASHRTKQNYGQHTAGMTKFNEMFPGVMGGDLGFDPMAIAMQMNPANQQQVALETMQKLMNGNPIDRVMDTKVMQPTMTGANAAASTYNQSPQSQQINPSPNMQPAQPGAVIQQSPPANSNLAGNEHQQQSNILQQQPQAFTALAGAPTINQNQPHQQYQQPASQKIQQQPIQQNQQQPTQQYQQQLTQQYQQQPTQQHQQQPTEQYQQQLTQQYQQQPTQQYQQQPTQQYQQRPAQQYQQPSAQQYQHLEAQSIAAPNLPTMHEGKMTESNVPPQSYNAPPSPGQMIKEPIFPVDGSRWYQSPSNAKHQRAYEYNTLGQPVELLPAKMYHTPPPTSQQQTLSPQPVSNQPRFAVKNTVSKTSIMGSKPIGRAASRGQLQQIYNQYKGSQSHTQQNIRPAHGATYSEGQINVTSTNEGQNRHVPVERVGGDTRANNQMVYQQVPVKGQPFGQSGDVPMPVDNKPHGDMVPTKEFPDKRCRNGLQDVVHTSFHTSKGPSWSFHGNNIRSGYPPLYRSRGRA